MKYVLFALNLLFHASSLFGQAQDTLDYPEVGKPMPEFTVRNIKYYSKNKATLKDFRGKWLLLDFWNKYCGACIESFPYMNEIQKNLGNKVQVMLVGIQDKEEQIEPMYAKFKERKNLIIPCAFDSTLANRFDIFVAPHSILIDEKGIVRCITSSVSMADIKGFLADNVPILPKTYRRMHDGDHTVDGHYSFDFMKPFLIRGNGGNDTDFLFRTVLSSWNHDTHSQFIPSSIRQNMAEGKFQVLGAPLECLFNYAYFGYGTWGVFDTALYGKYYIHPILKIRDTLKFKYSFKYSRNIYSYSLLMPFSMCTEESMKTALQRDLATYFGFESCIKIRKCPYWKLVASKRARLKLKTKGGEPYIKEPILHTSLLVGNQPITELVQWLRINQQDKIIIDETGIRENIDISMDCIPSDLSDLKRALNNNGLDLVMAKKNMQVVEIKDKKR